MKFRIGYLSDAFCDGRSKDFFPVFFTAYDQHRFEVYGYHTGPVDQITEVFSAGKVCWRNLTGCSAAEAAQKIQADALDLLVDLSQGGTSAEIEEILRQCKEVRIFRNPEEKWCYTPFVREPDYVVSAPFLAAGVLTFGVCGRLPPEKAEVFIENVGYLLSKLPQSRLLLPSRFSVICNQPVYQQKLQRKGVRREQIVCLSEDRLPYEELDMVLGLYDLHVYDICRFADHAIPVVLQAGQEAQNLQWTMQQIGLGEFYTRNTAAYVQEAVNLARNHEKLCRLHQLLRWKLHDSALMDVDAYMIAREEEYDRCIFAGKRNRVYDELVIHLDDAQRKKDWQTYIWDIAELNGCYELPLEKNLLAAWAYFFLHDLSRTYYWAWRAEKHKTPKRFTQFYLMAKGLVGAGNWQELWNICVHAFQIERTYGKMMPEVRFALLMLYAAMAYRLGKSEMTDLYWQTYEAAKSFEDRCTFFSAWLMSYNCKDIPAKEIYEKHCRFNELFVGIKPYRHQIREKKQKLRVGYISPDFRAHVMSYFCWPFLATFDRDGFEVYVYSLGKTDQYTEAFRKLVTKWNDIKEFEFKKIAAQIYKDKVDILVDLAGHTSNSGLPVLAWKPAPVQVSGLGYMTTTGLCTVDYFFTDYYVDPIGMNDEYFSEKLLRLHSQFCYNGAVNLPASSGTPARTRGRVLFGVFNQYTKVNDEMLQAWLEILRRVPRAQILFKGVAFAGAKAVFSAFERMRALGFDMNRVIFESASRDYMQRYLDVDIALDTYPYPGGGTTCDALYMGVPVITRYSDRHSARFSYGILSVIGMAELASQTQEGYIEKAVALAGDLDLLDGLHRNLRTMMRQSPLMDDTGYIREVEGFYRKIWQKYEEQNNG